MSKAESKLTEAIHTSVILIGKDNRIAFRANVLLIETKIRQNRLEEAYQDCLAIFESKSKDKNNFFKLGHITSLYHAAIIQYKLGDLKKSREYFAAFFAKIHDFSGKFLEK